MSVRTAAVALVFVLLLPDALRAREPVFDRTCPLYSTLEEVPLRPGRPVVLVFFSTVCPACWDDLFAVRLMIEESGFDGELVGVTRDAEGAVRAFLDKYGFACPVVRDARKRLFRAHAVELEPAAVAVEDDRVVYRDDPYLGYPARREELKKWMMRRSGRRISA